MYIPFLAKQKANAWQLAVLPCVFGMLFFFAAGSGFGFGSLTGLLAGAALLGGAVTLLGFLLIGGLRACGMGLCLFLAGFAGWAAYVLMQEQKVYGTSARYQLEQPTIVLFAALGACMLVFLIRVLLPKRVLTPDAKANFRSFFWTAGVGVAVFAFLESSIFLLGLRK